MDVNSSSNSHTTDVISPASTFGATWELNDSTITKSVTVTVIVDFISDQVIHYIYSVQLAIVCASLCLFGITTNMFNIIVFVKMRFKETTNIALLGLAISDTFALLSLLWICICVNPLFRYADSVDLLTFEIQHKTGGWTHMIFTRVTAVITFYITLERCLCIAFPLKIKTILTPTRVLIIIVGIYCLIVGSLGSNYGNFDLGWKFSPEFNRTMLGVIYRDNRVIVQTVAYFLNVVYVVIPFTGVIICSSILIWKLKQRSKFLHSSTTSELDKTRGNSRDNQVMKMVVYVAVIFIGSFTPSVLLFFAMAINPELNLNRSQENLFMFLATMMYTMNAINSSVNFFVYIRMSSKFSETFRALFGKPIAK